MKKLIYIAAFTLAITSSVPAVWANEKPGNSSGYYLGNSTANPSDTTAVDATHKFEVYVGKPLAELVIDLPEGVKINRGIEVKNQTGQKIPATVSINNRKATVAFSQPVEPETKLSILMNGVNTIGNSEAGYSLPWIYRVYAKNAGSQGEISLGVARIQTYPI
ncbi:MAG: DUF2808 domain-containing protein [Brasilonema octagenarum HA4186-MV1]|jgi:hypothetical protein|nr:DUF2808 domain-containing protein [Brasilonema octagenarum HA4186-MV1]